MSSEHVGFDSVLPGVVDTLRCPKHPSVQHIYVIRDLYGRVRIAVADALESDADARAWLQGEAETLHDRLGTRAHPPDDAVLFLEEGLVAELHRDGREVLPGVILVDRLVTGAGWWSVNGTESATSMYTLYSVKGGTGRSTTAAVLAWHLAKRGENVLVVDLDLESPGISSAMLDHSTRPEYGVVDWFVEDLVGQGDPLIEDMIARPSWQQDLPGDVCIAPAYGARPGEYLAKLGRLYMDTDVRWTQRLDGMLQKLRHATKPSIVLLESRSGLHDIAAATVTDLNAHVLLFATNSETSWQDYGILFRHWNKLRLGPAIRERLSMVSGLTPDIETEDYIKRFRERAWALFQDHLYDSAESAGEPGGFAFDVLEDQGPHNPMPIYWSRGLAASAPLHHMEGTLDYAYGCFLERFDALVRMNTSTGR